MVRLANATLWLVFWLLVMRRAAAGVVDSPEYRRDLAAADQLIHAVRLRENSVQADDFVGLCRLLRHNLQDMTKAREPTARCITGHDLGENVGQMDASIGDIGASKIWLQDAEDTGHFGLRSNAKSSLYLMQNQHKQGTSICAACKCSSLSPSWAQSRRRHRICASASLRCRGASASSKKSSTSSCSIGSAAAWS